MTVVVTVGTAVQDLILTVDSLPRGDGKTFADNATIVGGGPAATAAATVVTLGGAARFIGRVGDDAAGAWIRADLDRWGVDTTLLATVPGIGSAVSSVVVASNGERMIVNHTDPALFAAPLPTIPSDVDVVLADLRWPAGALAAMIAADRLGIPGVLDVDLNTGGDTAVEAIRHASHLVFARPMLAELSGHADPERGLRHIAKEVPNAALAVTLGSEGTLWIDRDESRVVPAFDVEVVDTTGAGDVFHGAFALRLAEGATVEECLHFASAAAAAKCRRSGGREGLPDRQEVNALMEERT